MAGAFQADAFQNDAFQTDNTPLGLINQTAVIFAPAVTYAQNIALGLIDQTATASAPTLSINVYSAAVAADAPIAYWRLGEASGVFVDSFVGNDGSASGTVTRGAAGIDTNNGITVNNAGRVTIPDSADMDFTTPFSIEMWVKQSSANFSDNALWGKGTGGVPYVFVTGSGQSPAGRVTLAKSDTADVVQSSALITDTDWHHIVITYSHNTEAKIYVDANDVGGTPSYQGFNTNSTDAAIGSKTGASNDSGWRGSLDEVAIYDYTLSPSQVTAHWQAAALARTVTVARITQTATINAPVVARQQFLTLGVITQTAVAFAPEVSSIFVTLPRIDQTAVAFAPVISPQNVSLGLITQTTASYAPTITTGATTVVLGLINQGAIARPPLVSITTEVDTGGGPGGPGSSGATSHTRVFIAGLGNVAPIVIWSQSVLETAEGGEASAGVIAIRDVGIERADFTPMARVTIDRGAGTDPIYSGYLIKPSRRFFFPVDYPDTLQRMWILNVADINLLWSRRVTYNQSDPADIEGPIYVNDTYDDVALRELFDNWVDLSTDDLDVTTRIRRVGLINYDQPAYPFNGGQTLGDAVTTIAQLPAAVYGINSNRQVVYADVDDENAPFVLTDAPVTGGWEPVGSPGKPNAGYREMTLLEDGTRLCNDVMSWGFGMGAPLGVFKRLRSQTSIDEHGLWQDAHVIYSIYKQATINKVADSVINGSPQSKRGQKNDNVSVELVTFEDGLHVGDRVRFISHIWQYEDVIPVRKIEISFPTPYDVRYKFLLSHEIDRWGFQDPLPPFPLPGPYPIPGIPPFPPILPPPVFPPSCVEAAYSVDEFASTAISTSSPYTNGATVPVIWNNQIGSGLDSWLNWVLAPVAAGSSATVNTTTRLATATVVSDEFGVRMAYRVDGAWVRDVVTAKFRFKLSAVQAGYEVQFTFGAMRVDVTPSTNTVEVVTGSGTTSDSFSDWGTPGTDFYVLECHLDLVNDSVEAHIYREGSSSDPVVIARAADGERVGVGDYEPEIGIFWLNSGSAVTFTMSPLRLSVYADATTPVITAGLFDFTDPVWIEYTDDNVIGADPSVTYESDGTITLVDDSLAQDGSIRRDVNSGGVDLAFCISDYATITDRSLILLLSFGGSAPRECRVFFGNDPFVDAGTGTGSALSGPTTTLFDSGNPVNVRVQFNGGGMRVRQWAGGSAEPGTWDAEVYFAKEPWPRIHLDVQMWGNFLTGDSLKLGPLQFDTGESSEYLIPYPDELGWAGGAPDIDPPTAVSSGRRRSWPFTDPGGMAVPFGDDIYTTATNSVPSYSVGIVWPVFGPTEANGILYEINQRLTSLSLPAVMHKGVEIEYKVRVRGTATVDIGEATRDDLGATGIPGRVNVIIERFDYGTGAAAPGGVPNPPYIDYNILNGLDVWNRIYDSVSVPSPESAPFDVLMDPVEISGVKYLQWGVYYEPIDDPLLETIRQAGPLWGGIFLVTGNNGHLQAIISGVSYEIVPTALGFPIQYNPDACQPNPVGYDYGDPESGRICITFTGNGTGDEFDLPNFVPGSADVIVDGYTLTPGRNYTEDDDHLGVTIPIPPPDGSWVLICVTVI